AAAKSLATSEGWLSLRSLTALSDTPGHVQLAARLASQGGARLDLDGLTTLSDAAAQALSQDKGGLSLNGLRALSDAVAATLARHEGWLSLRGLIALSDSPGHLQLAARLAARGDQWLILKIQSGLPSALAETLAKHKGALSLRRLTALSDAAAQA